MNDVCCVAQVTEIVTYCLIHKNKGQPWKMFTTFAMLHSVQFDVFLTLEDANTENTNLTLTSTLTQREDSSRKLLKKAR